MTAAAPTRTEKHCPRCGEMKNRNVDFHKCKSTSDGLVTWCKDCCRVHARKMYLANRENVIARGISYRKERSEEVRQKARERYLRNRELRIADSLAYQAANPEKRRAHYEVQLAVRFKRLNPQPCEVCGATRAEAHHDDYSKPLEVRWLCSSHHKLHHAEVRHGNA